MDDNSPAYGVHELYPEYRHLFSEKAKQRLYEVNKGNQHWLGKRHSEKTKEKMSKSGKGRVFTEEHRINLSNRQFTEEWKRNIGIL